MEKYDAEKTKSVLSEHRKLGGTTGGAPRTRKYLDAVKELAVGESLLIPHDEWHAVYKTKPYWVIPEYAMLHPEIGHIATRTIPKLGYLLIKQAAVHPNPRIRGEKRRPQD